MLMPCDRRVVQRQTRFVFGTVRCADGRELLCAVRDTSALGAQIEVENTKAVPDEFSLQIEGVAHARDCMVVWRNKTKIGAAFLPTPLVVDASP